MIKTCHDGLSQTSEFIICVDVEDDFGTGCHIFESFNRFGHRRNSKTTNQ